MLNPFDLKAALAAKHAQHVVLIHFPIALFIAGAAFDFAAHGTKKQTLAAAAYYNFLVAAVASIPTMITGLLAWQWQLEGQRLKGVLLLHLVMGFASSGMIWLVWWLHFRDRRAGGVVTRRYVLPIEFLAVLVVSFTGHLGGFLSGVNGPR